MKIKLHTEKHPEDNAMLQGLYSRSPASVDDHLEKLAKVGSGDFMNKYYVNYGHSSLGDCGYITIYIEGVSMLAAKAVQDNALYAGQEVSSRFVNWSNQFFINPFETEKDPFDTGFNNDVANWVEYKTDYLYSQYRLFYISNLPKLVTHIKTKYPRQETEKETVYDKAVLARAFDILRGFLPCGASTNVAWTTSLRKANDHVRHLAAHPLLEVRQVAHNIHKELIATYPNSIKPLPAYADLPTYEKLSTQFYGFRFPCNGFETFQPVKNPAGWPVDFQLARKNEDFQQYMKAEYLTLINDRPKYSELPKHDTFFDQRIIATSVLDFGSYRDLQRHRNMKLALPIIFMQSGFEGWYYDELPEGSKAEADKLFAAITKFCVEDKYEHVLELQYILPMGTLLPISIDMDTRQALYLAELRSGKTVHATLRPLAQALGKKITEHFGIKTYCDFDADSWTIRRGSQDIVEKVVQV